MYGVVFDWIVLYGVVLYCIVWYCIAWPGIVFYISSTQLKLCVFVAKQIWINLWQPIFDRSLLLLLLHNGYRAMERTRLARSHPAHTGGFQRLGISRL